MCSDNPLVSVIIPAYNAATLIERTLRSVMNQTHQNLEILVVDDGSTDQTSEVVMAIAHQDSRLQLLHQANAGVAAARNLAIAQAQGEFIAPIDADDLWHPQAIEKLLEALQNAGEDTALAYTWSVDIDEQDQPLGGVHAATIQGTVLKTLLCHNFIGNASATLIRRSCLEQLGDYDTQLRAQNAQGCEDWDLYLRLAVHFNFAVVPQVLVGYRKGSNSMSGDFSQMARSHTLMMNRLKQLHPGLSHWFYQLSASSFYIYFAHQCFDFGKPEKTMYWLRQALHAECITPLLRPGVYRLALVSWWQSYGFGEHSSKTKEKRTASGQPLNLSSQRTFFEFLSLPLSLSQVIQIRSKLFVSSFLHRFLAFL